MRQAEGWTAYDRPEGGTNITPGDRSPKGEGTRGKRHLCFGRPEGGTTYGSLKSSAYHRISHVDRHYQSVTGYRLPRKPTSARGFAGEGHSGRCPSTPPTAEGINRHCRLPPPAAPYWTLNPGFTLSRRLLTLAMTASSGGVLKSPTSTRTLNEMGQPDLLLMSSKS